MFGWGFQEQTPSTTKSLSPPLVGNINCTGVRLQLQDGVIVCPKHPQLRFHLGEHP